MTEIESALDTLCQPVVPLSDDGASLPSQRAGPDFAERGVEAHADFAHGGE